MTTPDITKALDELYAIDPSLREHEEQLKPLLLSLLKNDPARLPDETFVEELRTTLRLRAVELQDEADARLLAPRSSESVVGSFLSFFSMNHIPYVAGGAVLASVVLVPLLTLLPGQSGVPSSTENLFSYSVTATGDKAFGDLTKVQDNVSMTRSQSGGGGGGGGAGGAPSATDAALMESSNTIDGKMIAPGDITEYEYVFAGELPTLDAEVGVLKREKNTAQVALSAIAGAFNVGLANLNSFGGSTVESINFVQDKAYGYAINLQMREGMLSINQNWARWPHPENDCRDDACYQKYRVKLSEIPTDDVLVGIANDFLKDHGIDVSTYGTPEVDNQWKIEYDKQTDKTLAYVPENMRVIYPQLVDGKPVYEEYGPKAGMSVGVSVREKKVTDMWGLMDQKYLKSNYLGVTDANTVRDYLARFEKQPTLYRMAGTKVNTVKVQLGTPVVSFAKYYSYENDQSNELIVPSLVFPVQNTEGDTQFYRQSVTIPLAKELLEKRLEMMNPGGMPIPID